MCETNTRCAPLWENVLVEWANCLSLAKHLNSIKDFNDGEFYLGLLRILSNSSDVSKDDIHIKLYDYLSVNYPNIQLSEDADLVTVLSLCMHYTCILDGRESLTTPLCSKLSEEVQFCLKYFLEVFTADMSEEALKRMIKVAVERCSSYEKEPKSFYQWQPAGDSPHVQSSPLQDFLRTPTGKSSRMQERDKEIKKLHLELQMERFEKDDLVMELKEHKLKIKKISDQVSEKNQLISKLQGEIVGLENKTPPHKPKDMQEIERILRAELANSQDYINQLQTEQEALRINRDETLTKLEKLTQEATLWQRNSSVYESNYSCLKEVHQQQTQELNSLRLNYNELSAFLEELRSAKSNESQLDVDICDIKANTSETSSYEDLACSVIEVQLREAQQENQDLNKCLKIASQKSIKLEDDLIDVKKSYDSLTERYLSLQEVNEELESKVLILKESQLSLQRVNNKLTDEVKQLTNENSTQAEEFLKIEHSLYDMKAALTERDSLVHSLQKDITILQNSSAETEEFIKQRNEQYVALQKESEAWQVKYEESIVEYGKKQFAYESLSNMYKKLDEGFEENLHRFESLVTIDEKISFEDKLDAFKVLLDKLEAQDKAAQEDAGKRNDAIAKYQDLVESLNGEIRALHEKDNLNVCMTRRLEGDIEKVKQQCFTLEREIEERNNNVDKLNTTINHLNSNIKEFNDIKLNMEAETASLKVDLKKCRENIITNTVESDTMKQLIQELQEARSKLEAQLFATKNDLSDTQKSHNEVIKSKEAEAQSALKLLQENDLKYQLLHKEYTETNHEHLEKINELNTKLRDYENRLELLQTDLNLAEGNCSEKSAQLSDLTKLKVQIEARYEQQTMELQKKADLLQLTLENLERDLEGARLESRNVHEKLKEQEEKYAEQNVEWNNYREASQGFQEEIVKMKEKVATKDSHCKNKDEVISKSTRELVNLKLQLESKQTEIKSFYEKMDLFKIEKEKTILEINQLNEQNNELNSKISGATMEIEILTKLKEALNTKCCQLEEQILKILNQLGVKDGELTDAVENLIEYQQSTQLEINELKTKIKEINEELKVTNEKCTCIAEAQEKEIKNANELITNLNAEIDVMRTREISLLHEIGMLKEELAYTVNKYTETLETEKDLKLENDTQITCLTESIHSMVEKYNKLDIKHQAISDELNATKATLEDMEVAKQQLEIQITQQKKRYQYEFVSAADEYQKELTVLSSQQIKLQSEIERLSLENEENSTSKIRLQTELDRAKCDLADVVEEKKALLLKIQSAVNSNKQFDKECEDLNIKNEMFMKENELTLYRLQSQYETNIMNTRQQQSEYEEKIRELKSSMNELNEAVEQKKRIHEECITKKDEEIESLKARVIELEKRIGKLNSKQEDLANAYSQEKLNDKTQSNGREETLLKLRCAYDILNAGKRNLDQEHDELLVEHKLLQQSKTKADAEHEDDLHEMRLKLNSYELQLEEKMAELQGKETQIQETYRDIDSINKILEVMRMECETLRSEKHSLYKHLEIIEEDSDSTIKQQIEQFKEVKSKYAQLQEEILEMQVEHKILNDKLLETLKQKEVAEDAIKQKEDNIIDLKNKHDSLSTILCNKDMTINSLQQDLEAKIVQLEIISSEKHCIELKLEETSDKLQSATKLRDDILQKHTALIKDTETNFLRAHENAIHVKNDLVNQYENSQRDKNEIKAEVDRLIEQEKNIREFFEVQLLELKKENHQFYSVQRKLQESVQRLCSLIQEKPIENTEEASMESLNEVIYETERKMVEIFAKSRELNEEIKSLEKEKANTTHKLQELEKCNVCLTAEKEKLLENFEKLHDEKLFLVQEKNKESKCLENLKTQYEILKNRYEEAVENNTSNSTVLFESKIEELKLKNVKIFEDYQEFLEYAKLVKKNIDKMVGERNSLENVITTLKDNHINLQIKSAFITEEDYRLHHEQKQALDVIIDDIQKQFNRFSKMSYNISLNTCQIFERTITGILTEKPVKWQTLFKELNIEEVLEKLEDLKDNSLNTLEQLKIYEKSVQQLNGKVPKRVLKENNGEVAQPKLKEEDWKKKYSNVKQRLTLIENAKNNYEKKIKQLREENKKLGQNCKGESDVHYQNLLQQHLQSQEEHERTIADCKDKYRQLSQEFELYKRTNSNAQVDYLTQIKSELDKVREAYGNALSDNSKLEADNASLRSLLDDRNTQIAQMHHIKESYERMFEENNKLMNEIDTLKYKRNRDREEYVRLLKQERDEGESNKKLQEVRVEYEVKLEKMKNKLIQLYKDEVDRQVFKANEDKKENELLIERVEKLKNDLYKANLKLQSMETGQRSIALQGINTQHQLHESRSEAYSGRDSVTSRDYRMLMTRGSTQSLCSLENVRSIDDRRYSTLPKNINGMDVIEEVRICRRTSINAGGPTSNIEMEDEGEMFNNKYLLDLKEGRCNLPTLPGRESTASRLSELAYRNSLCPPHLKSSYPLETQFHNPRRFKEDDLKAGHVDLDDSLSTRLLPYEKPKKKDIGTTTYKRPGPPTPSKNGGRLSLQGNEVHPRDSLHEHKSPKKTTPNRLKLLFSRSKDTSESSTPTPKSKRLSFFKKQR